MAPPSGGVAAPDAAAWWLELRAAAQAGAAEADALLRGPGGYEAGFSAACNGMLLELQVRARGRRSGPCCAPFDLTGSMPHILWGHRVHPTVMVAIKRISHVCGG